MKPSTNGSNNITMESLALPEELYWDGKMEPTSPLSANLFSIYDPTDNWQLLDSNFANEISINTELLFEIKPGFELIDEDDLVVELDNLKEEHWNDSKLDSSPQYLDYSISTLIPSPSSSVTKVQNYHFAYTSGTEVDATLTQLTPPQSPPHTLVSPAQLTTPCLINVNDVLVDHQLSTAAVSPTHSTSETLDVPIETKTNAQFENFAWNGNSSTVVAAKFIDEIERETQIVDEIVNRRAQELIDWNDDAESMSSLSPQSFSDEEPNSPAMGSMCSISQSPLHGTETDGEKEELSMSVGSSSSSSSDCSIAPIKKRTRPYGRGVEDRKIRKKEQNKNAATRYRQKKKQEMEIVLTEEQELSNLNNDLKRKLAERNREAKYLKTLIREFYRNNKI